MRNLTAATCLTIALIIGSAGASYGQMGKGELRKAGVAANDSWEAPYPGHADEAVLVAACEMAN